MLLDPNFTNRNWHISSVSKEKTPDDDVITVEMCMTGLDKDMASVFYKSQSGSAGLMTINSGIRKILPDSEICDFDFDPCGYSMNSVEGPAVSTIHVTPEDGFSYASFETVGYNLKDVNLKQLVPVGHCLMITMFVLVCFKF